jgi:hypothetical protein
MPKDTTSSRRIVARATMAPDITALQNELNATLAQCGMVRGRQDTAARIRFAEWDGQSDDYRKHAEDIGEAPLTGEGSSDSRLRVADMIINERVALQVNALMAGEIQGLPTAMDNAGRAAQVSRLLRHVRDVQLRQELRREATLLANYQEADDPGYGVLKVWWKRKLGLEMRTLTVQELGEFIMRQQGIAAPDATQPGSNASALAAMEIGDILYNSERTDEALALLGEVFPSAQAGALRGALRSLRRTGECDLPVPFVQENRLCFTALRFMQDVFFPPDVDDVQHARVIGEREWLDEAALRDRAASEEWDESFVEAVIAAGPGSGVGYDPYNQQGSPRSQHELIAGTPETESLYEIFHAYTRAYDDMGIEGVYWTVLSMKVTKRTGLHRLLDYPDGKYPFVDFRREHIGRGVHTSRGTPGLVGSDQQTLKSQRDMQVDAAQLHTCPPLNVVARAGGIEAVLGPFAQNKVRSRDDITALNLGQGPQSSMLVEQAVNKSLNEYWGRLVPDVAPELRAALLQGMTEAWLDAWTLAWQKGLMLLQANMDPVALALVGGGEPQVLTREEIRGQFAVSLQFSINDLNLDFVVKRLTAIAQVLPMDIAGEIDRSYIVKAALRGIDPSFATFGVRSAGAATQAETKDEVDRVQKMAVGLEPPAMQGGGVNATLRLETLQRTIASSPVLQRRYYQPTTPDDQLFKELVDKESKNLQFLYEQYAGPNKAAGLTGVKPVLAAA